MSLDRLQPWKLLLSLWYPFPLLWVTEVGAPKDYWVNIKPNALSILATVDIDMQQTEIFVVTLWALPLSQDQLQRRTACWMSGFEQTCCRDATKISRFRAHSWARWPTNWIRWHSLPQCSPACHGHRHPSQWNGARECGDNQKKRFAVWGGECSWQCKQCWSWIA